MGNKGELRGPHQVVAAGRGQLGAIWGWLLLAQRLA